MKTSSVIIKRTRNDHAQDSPQNAKNPKLSDDRRMCDLIDEKLSQQNEWISAQFLESDNRMLALLNKQFDDFKRNLNEKFDALKRDLTDVTAKVTDVTARVDKLETVYSELDNLKTEFNTLKSHVARQDNAAVACDLRLTGIPFHQQENLPTIFGKICATAGIVAPTLQNIFRIANSQNKTQNNRNTDPVIIAKLRSPYDKNFVLKSIANFRRNTRDLLRLHHLGFESDVPVYINECLTQSNNIIFREATRYKKNKKLTSVFTLRGLVYVRKFVNDDATHIDSISQLHAFVDTQQNNNNANQHTFVNTQHVEQNNNNANLMTSSERNIQGSFRGE